MQSPTNFPTASAWLEIVVTKAPDLSFLVSSGVASGLLDGEVLLRTASRRERIINSPRPALRILTTYLRPPMPSAAIRYPTHSHTRFSTFSCPASVLII